MKDRGENWWIDVGMPPEGISPAVHVHGPWSTEVTSTINHFKIQELRLSAFKGKDLLFLSEVPQIRKLSIQSCAIEDIRCLEHLDGIEELSIDMSVQSIDFGCMRSLHRIQVIHKTFAENVLDAPNLVHLGIGNARIADLRKIARAKKLESLNCGNRELLSLNGFDALARLRHLGVSNISWQSFPNIGEVSTLESLALNGGRRLVDISQLSKLKNLRVLKIVDCRNLERFEPIMGHAGIEGLLIDRCKSISSIKFIEQCKDIKAFAIAETRVLDDKFDVLVNAPKLRWASYKQSTSSISADEIRARISQREVSPPSTFNEAVGWH